MLFSFRSRLSVLLATGALLLSSSGCTKSDPSPAATATTGSLEGTVSPAAAVTKVTATAKGGLTFLATPNSTTGLFSLADLAPGEYSLSFTPAAGYLSPADRTLSIVAGQKASAGTVAVSSDGTIRSGTMSWTTDGVNFTATSITGQLDESGHKLYILGESLSGTRRDQLSLSLYQSFYGNATYRLGGTYEIGQVIRIENGIKTGEAVANSNGTLTITNYSVANGTISGSFGFIGPDYTTYPTKAVTVTNGTFSLHF